MDRVGRYELIRSLGRGGAGRVWEAVLHGPAGMTKRVALKVLEDGSDAVRREARIGGLLRHPGLVDVYEVGDADGRWFCAMELCPGGDLARAGPLPPRAVAEVGVQVAEALAHAHEELGLVHLDLKPANLFVAGGQVKVGDLGIARARGFAPTAGAPGTLGFMAPEQQRGGPVDPRTDVFALGRTLEALLGRGGVSDTLDVVGGHWAADAPRGEPAGVPPELEAVIERCVAPRPADRFPDMAAVAEALRDVVLDGPGLAEHLRGGGAPASEPDRPPRPVAREVHGREALVAAVLAALERSPVVALRGPPGIGKSTLAAAVARAASASRVVATCELGWARDEHDVAAAVAGALGLPAEAADAARLGRALAARGAALVVLDGADRVADLPALLDRWRDLAPAARWLVVGRSVARALAAEVVEVPPLDVEAGARLVAERAAERGVVALDPARVRVLVERLDGVPLALELAAARLGVLGLDDVLERLGLALLRDHDASAALAQLSVFERGFTVELAEEVIDADAAAVDLLERLVERSLVAVGPGGRLGLLASVQEYAAGRLRDDGAAARRHGLAFARLARAAVSARRRTDALAPDTENVVAACRRGLGWRDASVVVPTLITGARLLALGPSSRRAVELAEAVRAAAIDPLADAWAAAFSAAAQHRLGRTTEAHHLVRSTLDGLGSDAPHPLRRMLLQILGGILRNRGEALEALAVIEQALASTDEPGARASLLADLGACCWQLGRPADAIAAFEEGLVACRVAGDVAATEGLLLTNLGVVYTDEGRLDAAFDAHERADAIARREGDRLLEGRNLVSQASALAEGGALEPAAAGFRRALAIALELGDRRAEALAVYNLSELLRLAGDAAGATELADRALAHYRDMRDARGEGLALARIATLQADRGELDDARRTVDAAERLVAATNDGPRLAVVIAMRAGVLARAGALVEAAAELARAKALAPALPPLLVAEVERLLAR